MTDNNNNGVVIQGIAPYDGRWPLDIESLTNRDLHTIKRIAGIRAGELGDALLDNDLLVALAVIALGRAGRYVDEDLLWDARPGAIGFEGPQVEDDDANPPPPSTTGGVPSSAAGGSGASSGPNGLTGSETNQHSPLSTGQGSSAPLLGSDPPISLTSPLGN